MIETENLGRYFGEIRAVDGVTFSVKKGDVLGFLGPNGAGKSTTMRLLTCFLTPSFGRAEIGGYDTELHPREVQRLVGYLPENAPLYGEMEVEAFLRFITEIRCIDHAAQKSAIDRVVQLTGLEAVVHQRIETLSRGYKRRVGLAQALIHDPEVLILDEPTDGLDPNQKHDVRTLINNMSRDKCIILSTHILEEVDAVCNRVVIIAAGKIVADSTPDELRMRSQTSRAITVSFRPTAGSDYRAEIEKLPGVARVVATDNQRDVPQFTIYPQQGAGDVLGSLLREVQGRNWKVGSLVFGTGQLDEVFRSLTKGEERVAN